MAKSLKVVPIGLRKVAKSGGHGEKSPYKGPYYQQMNLDGSGGKKFPFAFVPPCVPAGDKWPKDK